MPHELNTDRYARKASDEQNYGTKHPRRYEPSVKTIEATQPQQRARAHVHRNAATQSIADNTATDVGFDTVDFDNVGLFSSGQFTIPLTGKVTGTWQLHAHIMWAAAPVGGRELDILQNGTSISSTHILGSNDQMSQEAVVLINDPIPGTVYKVNVKQTSGGPLNLLTEPEHSYFEVIHLW